MLHNSHASIAVFGYRLAPLTQAADLVHAIDEMLQTTDAEPRRIHWATDEIAMIDRPGVRIAVGLLPPCEDDNYTHLVLAVGEGPDTPAGDDLLRVSPVHLADRLVYRVKDDLPYDTIMRGETPELVDETIILALFDLLRQTAPGAEDHTPAKLDDQPQTRHRHKAGPAEDSFDVIRAQDVPSVAYRASSWLDERATPTKPLRLTVHTVALSIMLYTAPLGAFLFTYSMLRDLTPRS